MRIYFSKETIIKLKEKLKIAEELNNMRLYKIIWCLLLINEGHSYKAIAELFDMTARTVRNWLMTFMIFRFSWLLSCHYKGRGRKPKLSKAQRSELYQIIVDGPEKYGFDCGVWYSALIVDVIQREFKVTYNPRYVCALLKKMGLSYQKAGFVSDRLDDEEYKKKREEWEKKTWPEILKKAKLHKGVILFGDEVSFAQWGSLSWTWAPKGKQYKVKTCGKRKGLKMFGVIEFSQGDFHYKECAGKFNGESYKEFLEQVIDKYSCPIFLIEDGAPYHGGKIINEYKEKMKKEGRLFVYRLPSYSPDKNPIEKLWRKTKKDATHCKYFPTFDALRSAVINAFNKYMEDAMKVVCVMKKLRESAGIA